MLIPAGRTHVSNSLESVARVSCESVTVGTGTTTISSGRTSSGRGSRGVRAGCVGFGESSRNIALLENHKIDPS